MENTRYTLFCHYVNELQSIKKHPLLDKEKLQELYRGYKMCVMAGESEWIDIYDDSGNILIGFLMIGHCPNCHPDADYYIEEAYIDPSYRRKKYMTKTVSNFVKSHPGTYCLLILNNNIAAHKLWPKVFSEIGYGPCELSDVGVGYSDSEQFAYKKI